MLPGGVYAPAPGRDLFRRGVRGHRFGLFVALPNGVEGLLPAAALPDDDYTYDEVRMTLTGCRTKAVWSFGMPLEVVCAAADPGSGQIDFALPEGPHPPVPSRPGRPREAVQTLGQDGEQARLPSAQTDQRQEETMTNRNLLALILLIVFTLTGCQTAAVPAPAPEAAPTAAVPSPESTPRRRSPRSGTRPLRSSSPP